MSILNVQGQEILKEIESNDSVLIDIWAPWCPSCKMLGFVLEDIQQHDQFNLVKVNADENEEFINKHQVLAIPTLLFFKNNQLVHRVTGFQPKESIIETLNKLEMIDY